jgi:hypothetical protein
MNVIAEGRGLGVSPSVVFNELMSLSHTPFFSSLLFPFSPPLPHLGFLSRQAVDLACQ